MSENNINSVVNQNTIVTYAKEWKESGYSGKPKFTFESVGMLEGCKLYISGVKEPVGEVAKRPQFVKLSKLNRVYLYHFKQEFKDLETAEKALKSVGIGTRDGKPSTPKKVGGWIFFKVKFVTNSGEETLHEIKYLWDKWEVLSKSKDISKDLNKIIENDVKLAKESAAKAKPSKSTASLKNELASKQSRIEELEKKIAELSKK